MRRTMHSILLCVVASLFLTQLVLAVETESESELELETEQSWPTTLLENTAMATDKWAPTPRTRLEKLQLIQMRREQTHLPSKTDRSAFFRDSSDSAGNSQDSSGHQQETNGKQREPISQHFDDAESDLHATKPPPSKRSGRKPCGRKGCGKKEPQDDEPRTPPPDPVEPPVKPPKRGPPPVPAEPKMPEWPTPPNPELPLPTPPTPSCGDMCDPKAHDPLLARVPPPPMSDEALATTGLEGEVLKKIMAKLKNRSGWLTAQKQWLLRATEAAGTIRREIELAEHTKNAVASDLEQLQIAQDRLSIKLKADQLKWSFKDKKITLEKLHDKLEDLAHAKADVFYQMRQEKDDITVLTNTLGTPAEQVQISPKELEDPLKFLEDVTAENP